MEYHRRNPRNMELEVKEKLILDILELRKYIEEHGIKQKYISEKCKIPEPKLSQILNGKRKCEVGEYANICNALGVDFERFIKKEEAV